MVIRHDSAPDVPPASAAGMSAPPTTAPALASVDAVIDALGGTVAVGTLTGKDQTTVSHWRRAARLPAHTYLILTAALEQRGYTAPPALWGMMPIPESLTSSRVRVSHETEDGEHV